MRPRGDLALVAAAFVLLVLVVAVLGARETMEASDDYRRSTFSTGPAGASGLTDALMRLGIQVQRLRRNPAWLPTDALPRDHAVLAIIGPADALDTGEGIALATRTPASVDLLFAGTGTTQAMRCFGWIARPRVQTLRAGVPGRRGDSLAVRAILRQARRLTVADSSGARDGEIAECRVPALLRTDTLLRTDQGAPAAVRLELAQGRTVTLIADDGLFSNRQLRETSAGPFALGLVADRYKTFAVDEFHQGYGPSASLAGAVLRWSEESPWGWAGWQLVGVGLLAMLAAGRRFGPARTALDRRRRSPLEHVRALATALAAARGHDLAVALLVQGLRRRLARGAEPVTGRALRADPRAWLAGVAQRARTPRGRAAATELLMRMSQPQPREGVLRAADLVEDLWTDLTPSRSPTT